MKSRVQLRGAARSIALRAIDNLSGSIELEKALLDASTLSMDLAIEALDILHGYRELLELELESDPLEEEELDSYLREIETIREMLELMLPEIALDLERAGEMDRASALLDRYPAPSYLDRGIYG